MVFSIMVHKLNFVVFVVAIASQIYLRSKMALTSYFNHNVKVPSIGKIETEIQNGEDVTGPNHGSISPVATSQLVSRAASDNAPARTRYGLATRNYLPSPSPCSTNS